MQPLVFLLVGIAMTSVTTDFERRRRERETTNDRVVCLVIACMTGVTLTIGLTKEAAVAEGLARGVRGFAPPLAVLVVLAVICATHVGLFILLRRGIRYDPRRKYRLVCMRTALLAAVCWAQWFNKNPDFGLLAPISAFTMAIVMTGLSFSRKAVLLAGCLSCVTYASLAFAGPNGGASLQATIVGTQVLVVATVITAYIVDSMLKMHQESVSNERLSRFFSPELAARIADEPEIALRAVENNVTVLFADISGFTEMSARMPPQQVVDVLNTYFPAMVEIVFRHGGMVEKFVGDAILGIWGAPFAHADDADRAVAAAVEMQRGVGALNRRLAAAGLPSVAIHVGICSGPAAAGYIGTETYIQYAVIGDTTNVASRACGVATSGEVLVTDSTREMLSRPDVLLEPLPPVAVKGKAAPLVLHRVRIA